MNLRSNESLLFRRKQMKKAIAWSGVLFLGFLLTTQQIISNGILVDFDHYLKNLHRPKLSPLLNFIILRIDDLGLRWVTATILLVTAILISRRFKSWRPLNLSFLSLVFLNIFVGVTKIGFGRCKPKSKVDICMWSDGMAYPSGHGANAIVTWGLFAYVIYRYTHRGPFEGFRLNWLVAIISISVAVVSLFRNTHWFTDLLGGFFFRWGDTCFSDCYRSLCCL